MTGTIEYASGRRYLLPELTGWNVTHTLGVPADSFSVRFPAGDGAPALLAGAVLFTGTWQGETVFRGVVDEYAFSAGGAGGSVRLAGRGMAARLLDNESEPIQYVQCTMEDILARHVRPCGIADIQWSGSASASGYTVESGASQWTALANFAKYVCGIEPRFSRTGRLLLTGQTGSSRTVTARSGAADIAYTNRRYGVLSSVTVLRTADDSRETVRNDAFLAEGGLCSRVVTMPRNADWEALRYTGAYQIACSARERETCALTLPEPFAAFAGDRLTLELKDFGLTGTWLAEQTRSWADENGCGTRVTMRKAE